MISKYFYFVPNFVHEFIYVWRKKEKGEKT